MAYRTANPGRPSSEDGVASCRSSKVHLRGAVRQPAPEFLPRGHVAGTGPKATFHDSSFTRARKRRPCLGPGRHDRCARHNRPTSAGGTQAAWSLLHQDCRHGNEIFGDATTTGRAHTKHDRVIAVGDRMTDASAIYRRQRVVGAHAAYCPLPTCFKLCWRWA